MRSRWMSYLWYGSTVVGAGCGAVGTLCEVRGPSGLTTLGWIVLAGVLVCMIGSICLRALELRTAEEEARFQEKWESMLASPVGVRLYLLFHVPVPAAELPSMLRQHHMSIDSGVNETRVRFESAAPGALVVVERVWTEEVIARRTITSLWHQVEEGGTTYWWNGHSPRLQPNSGTVSGIDVDVDAALLRTSSASDLRALHRIRSIDIALGELPAGVEYVSPLRAAVLEVIAAHTHSYIHMFPGRERVTLNSHSGTRRAVASVSGEDIVSGVMVQTRVDQARTRQMHGDRFVTGKVSEVVQFFPSAPPSFGGAAGTPFSRRVSITPDRAPTTSAPTGDRDPA